MEKHFNNKQIKALFDINGNGELTAKELEIALRKIDLGIEPAAILDYLDKNNYGFIMIDDFILELLESVSIEENQRQLRK